MPDVDDLSLLLATLREAGNLALEMQERGVKTWNKPDGSVLTEADLAVDHLLKSRILSARPNDGWLSEETPDSKTRLNHSRVWIADPIDGTRAYAAGINYWGTGMALVENGKPIIGAVFRPADNMMFHAIKNAGSFLNNTRLLKIPEIENAPVIAPRRFQVNLSTAYSTIHQSSSFPLLLRIAAVTTGEVRAAISQGHKYDWDLAAGHLILTEAGGCITALDGDEMIYNRENPWQSGLIASANAQSHKTLLNLVRLS